MLLLSTSVEGLNLHDLVLRRAPLRPWAEGENIPWDDPAFSRRVLREHLDQAHDLASRRWAIIEAQVRWLHGTLLGGEPGRVLDLACGPGLYLERLAALGHRCHGIDFGPASVAHARRICRPFAQRCTVAQADLREAEFGTEQDLAMIIYGQLNVFRREEALDILLRARRALRPGGRVVAEMQTEEAVRGDGEPFARWSTAASGVFSDRPHLLLHESVWDAESGSQVERWHIIDAATAQVERHAMTTVAYSDAEILALFERAGFEDPRVLPVLPGGPDEGELCAVVATAPQAH